MVLFSQKYYEKAMKRVKNGLNLSIIGTFFSLDIFQIKYDKIIEPYYVWTIW